MDIKTHIRLITPEIAEAMLDKNTTNRPLSQSHVRKLSSAMKRGEWALNGETIVIFKNGDIGDGQHRLSAIVATGISQKMLVVEGVDSNTFPTHGRGKPRNAADSLAIHGEQNSIRLASATRAYIAYHKTGREVVEISPTQILECLNAHPEIRRVCAYVAARKKLTQFKSSLIGYCAIASEKFGKPTVDEFLEQLESGIALQAGSPALLLRERLLNQGSTKLTPRCQDAFIIKAINAHVRGKKLAFLRWSSAEDFPSIQ